MEEAISLYVSSVIAFHPVIGTEGKTSNETCSLASMSDLYFLYKYDPSTSTIPSQLALLYSKYRWFHNTKLHCNQVCMKILSDL